jgi:hypothetical protein
MMAQDIKEIAQMMGTQFAEAVKLSEKADAEDIDSIIKSMDQSYQMYSSAMNEFSQERTKLLSSLDEVFARETLAVEIYTKEVAELRSRLNAFKKQKLGNKVSDETVAQRARANGMVSSLNVEEALHKSRI